VVTAGETRVAVLLGALALVLAGCAAGPAPDYAAGDQPETVELAGCHYFVRDASAEQLRLPLGVFLQEEPLEGWPAIQQREGVRRAATLTPDGRQGFPFGYWIRARPDSVEIGYPAGGALLLRLAVTDRLAGVARPVGDAVPLGGAPDTTSYAVVLVRGQCPED
jgi:hypothetical protein